MKFKQGTFYFSILIVIGCLGLASCIKSDDINSLNNYRERISINENWSFMKYDSAVHSDQLIYDVRP